MTDVDIPDWDKQRVEKIIEQFMLDRANRVDKPAFIARDALTSLIADVRAEAISWCWVEACSQYSRGMNPGDQGIPALLAKAMLDLNPKRD